MEARFVILLSVLAAAACSSKITLGFDRPSLRLAIKDEATFQCCCNSANAVTFVWIKSVMLSMDSSYSLGMNESERVEITTSKNRNLNCMNLKLKDITLNDTGLYQCLLTQNDNDSVTSTPGTFLQVHVPIRMILDINERSKNSIITAEGVLLLLFVLVPGFMLICKSVNLLDDLEKKRGREEENIYEGLNLDDCNSTYHQIQRSLVQGPYQDVINNDDDDIQLEKP